MTQLAEFRIDFDVARPAGAIFDEARCPNCKKLIATVSGDWASVKVRCHRCGEVVEAKRQTL